MSRPNSPLSPEYAAPVRYVLVYNTDSEDVPAFGVMVVSGFNTSLEAFNVRQATSDGEISPVLINGPVPIPAGAMGQGGFEPWPATVRYDRILSLGSEPAAGEQWGLQSGLWTLGKGLPGFKALTTGLNYLAVFARESASPLTIAEVDGSPSYSMTTTISLDQADGFSISQPSAGVVRVDILAATASQAGIVSTSGQAWTGNKDCETGVSSPYLKSGYYNPSVPTVFPQDVSADNLPGLHLQDDRTATPSESGVVPHAAVGLARILDQPAGSKTGGQLILRVRNTSGATATVSLCADSGANGVFLWDGSYWIYSGGSLKQGVSYSDFNGNVFTGGIATTSRPWRPYKGY